jgi:hypothetical protein
MKKTIIVLRGQPDSGKTAAITLAHRKLSKQGESVSYNKRTDANEIKAILPIDGVYVGFASGGDIPDRLQRSLQFLYAKGCAVIVCAARLDRDTQPFHMTIAVVNQFAKDNNFDVVPIDKFREEDADARKQVDRQTAKKIIADVRKAVARARLVEA